MTNQKEKHTTNYFNTFLEAAEDCSNQIGAEPPDNPSGKSIARLQYEHIHDNPYGLMSDELLVRLHLQRNRLPVESYAEVFTQLLSKGQPCMRASALGKQYGWGIHFNAEGRMALVSAGTPVYDRLRSDPSLGHRKAMRSRKR